MVGFPTINLRPAYYKSGLDYFNQNKSKPNFVYDIGECQSESYKLITIKTFAMIDPIQHLHIHFGIMQDE